MTTPQLRVGRGACFAFNRIRRSKQLRGWQAEEKRHVFLGKNLRIMNYVPYEIRLTKDTPTGMRYMVRCNRTGKYAITTWVGSTGSSMGTVECQGKYDYVMKKWRKIVGTYVPVT